MDGQNDKNDPNDQQPITFDKIMGTVPEDLRKDKSLETIKDQTSLVKGYVSAQKLIGSKISIPGEKDEAGWNELYGKLGRPEAPEKYQVERPKLAEGMQYDEALEKEFVKAAHKIGLSNKQANALIAWQNEMGTKGMEKYGQDMKSAEDTLKKEWGNNYDTKISVAQRVMNEYADEQTSKFLKNSGLDKNSTFLKFIYEIGNILVEDGGPPKGGGGDGGANTIEAARKKRDALLGDPVFSKRYFNQREPGHQEAVAEIFELNKVVFSGN